MTSDETPIDYDTYRLFAMYADGVPVAEIALAFGWASPTTVYQHLNQFPEKYAEAKKHLLEKRNAKYRRTGSLAVDIQIHTLEEYHRRLMNEPELKTEYSKLILESVENGYGDIIDKDKSNPELKRKARICIIKIEQLRETLLNIEWIRKNVKDIAAIGDTAEKRADLNEGKATERVVNVGLEPTKEEWEEFWKAQKSAGVGIDSESIGQ